MGLVDKIKAQARQKKMHIVLPEGSEPRTIAAAEIISTEGIASITLLGDKQEIEKALGDKQLKDVSIVQPDLHPKYDEYVEYFCELRKAKGMTPEKAKVTMSDPMYFGTMMIKKGDADGLVAGAINSTGNTIRPALQIIKTSPGIKSVSSCFIMEMPEGSTYGQDGLLVFGDCAIIIDPSAEEMAGIAISCAETAKALAGMDPKVAMLCFSTKGSAKHEKVDKVAQATELVKQLAPELSVDGELQADAALVASVGQLKSPGSKVAGNANVLVFPDLNAGNIGYKLVQRLAGAEAIGPICQGLAAPVNDLSRGCSVEDIVSVVAITAVQAQAK